MNIFSKFTLRSLKQNRARSIVTIIGIILSVAMITAVTTTVSSIQQFMLDVTAYNDGVWHVSVEDISSKQAQKIRNMDEIQDYATLKNVGYAKLDKSRNKQKPYLYIGAYAGDFIHHLSVFPIEGRLPKNSSEIVLPTNLSSNGGVQYKVGDTLSLSVGVRESSRHKLLWQSYIDEEKLGEEIGEETFVEKQKMEYKVVGIYRSAVFDGYSQAAGYPALTVAEKKQAYLGERMYVTLNEPKSADEFVKHLKVENDSTMMARARVEENKYYLLYSGNMFGNSSTKPLQGMMIILIGIIMFGSISLIGNSFSISVNERKKQYGLLSSIGATKRQLKRSVLFEAVVLSGVGIPLGVLAGIGGMSVTFFFIRDMLKNFINVGVETDKLELTLHMSAAGWAILLAAGIGFVTILISAYLPARKALKVSAIEAIRQTTDIKIRSRQVRTSKLTGRLFGIEGTLATKNYKRNRRKYRATVFSLFISIVLFISASSFCDYMSKGVETIIQEYDYDIRYSLEETKESIPLYQKLSETEGVTNAGYFVSVLGEGGDSFIPIQIEDECIGDKYRNDISLEKAKSGKQQMIDTVNVVFVEDTLYREYLQSQNLQPSEYINGKHSKAVIADIITTRDKEGVFQQYHMLKRLPKEITLCYPKNLPTGNGDSESDGKVEYGEIKSLTGTVVEEAPFGVGSGYNMVICYPESAMSSLTPDYVSSERVMSFCSNNPMQTYQRMSDLLEENGQATDHLLNIAEDAQSSQAFLIVMRIFSYGFIILISLIAMANVFNTISTNISLRKREFAMLQSIGLTNRSFHKMMNYECILYGLKGLLYGLPVAVGITYLIYQQVNEGVEMSFYIPWYSVIIAVVSVFAVVFATMLYATNKLRKENVVETLKNENY